MVSYSVSDLKTMSPTGDADDATHNPVQTNDVSYHEKITRRIIVV